MGYSYTWLGQYEQASMLLADLPDVIQELGVYIWWWGAMGREDLAGNAREMLVVMDSSGVPPNEGGIAP